MGGQTSATGGGSSLRLSAVGDLACTCVKTNTDPIMPAYIEEGSLVHWLSPPQQGELGNKARESASRTVVMQHMCAVRL